MATLKYLAEDGSWKVMTAVEGGGFSTLIVTELPTTNISTTTIYLLASQDTEETDSYEEYVYVNNTWEKLGNLDAADDAIRKSVGSEEEIDNLFKD